MRYFVSLGGATKCVDVRAAGDTTYEVQVDGALHVVELHDGYQFVDGVVHRLSLDRVTQRADTGTQTFPYATQRTLAATTALARSAAPEVRAPMPGKIVEVRVAVGDVVEAGTPVLIIEAMKMQNELTSPVTGRIERLHVAPGQAVEANALLLTLQSSD